MSEEGIISEYILPNGIRILHKHRSGQIAHLAMMVGTGMRDEQPDENGCHTSAQFYRNLGRCEIIAKKH